MFKNSHGPKNLKSQKIQQFKIGRIKIPRFLTRDLEQSLIQILNSKLKKNVAIFSHRQKPPI